jgi:hypothetical protein
MLLFIVFTRGLILSKMSISIGLCFLMGLRIEKTIKAIMAEKAASVTNTSPIINVVISQALIKPANCKTQSKAR